MSSCCRLPAGEGALGRCEDGHLWGSGSQCGSGASGPCGCVPLEHVLRQWEKGPADISPCSPSYGIRLTPPLSIRDPRASWVFLLQMRKPTTIKRLVHGQPAKKWWQYPGKDLAKAFLRCTHAKAVLACCVPFSPSAAVAPTFLGRHIPENRACEFPETGCQGLPGSCACLGDDRRTRAS